MKRTMGGAALVAALVALAPWQAEAQVGPRGQRGMMAGQRGASVEAILRQKEQLGLTDAQVRSLDQIRQEGVQRRTAHQAQVAELMSKTRAGQVEAAEFRAQAQARREAAAEFQKEQRERVEGILTEAQKQKLREWGNQARAFQMGRQSAMRGRMMAPGAAWGGRGGWGGGAGTWQVPQGNRGGGFRGGYAPGMMRQRWGPAAPMAPGFRRGMGFGRPWADSIKG